MRFLDVKIKMRVKVKLSFFILKKFIRRRGQLTVIRDFNSHRYSKASIQFIEILNELNQKELFEIQSIIYNYIADESPPFVKNEISGFGMLAIDMAFRKTRFNKKQIGDSNQEILDNMLKTITKPSIGFLIKLNKEGTIEKSKMIITRMNSSRFGDYIVFNYFQSPTTMVYDFLKLLEKGELSNPKVDKIVLFNLTLIDELEKEKNQKLKFKKIKNIISEVKRQVSLDDLNNILGIIAAIKKKKRNLFIQLGTKNQEDALVLSQIDLLSAASRELNNLDFSSLSFWDKIQYKIQRKIFNTKGYLYRKYRSGIGYFLKW